MSRTRIEIADELHALNSLLTEPAILQIEKERDDLNTLESIRAQVHVIQAGLNYTTLLAEYEDSDSEYVFDAAHTAWRWLWEDDEAPSALWKETAEVWESTATVPA